MVDYRDPSFGNDAHDAHGSIELVEAGRRLRTAFWWMIASIVVGVVVGAASAVVGALLTGQGTPSAGSSRTFQIVMIVGTLVSSGMFVAVAVMWWRATAPVVGVTGERDAPRARQGVRLGYLAAIVVALASGLYSATGNTPSFAPSSTPNWAQLFPPTAIAFMVISFAITAAYYTASAYYLRWLVRLVSPPDQNGFAEVCVWLIPLLATVGILLFCMGPLAAYVLLIILMYNVAQKLILMAPAGSNSFEPAHDSPYA